MTRLIQKVYIRYDIDVSFETQYKKVLSKNNKNTAGYIQGIQGIQKQGIFVILLI